LGAALALWLLVYLVGARSCACRLLARTKSTTMSAIPPFMALSFRSAGRPGSSAKGGEGYFVLAKE
jgi:hypothetical protein